MSKMINCKSCGAEIASSAKSCPKCRAKNKKPIYLRWWFVVIVLFVVIGAIGSIGGNKSSDDNQTKNSSEINNTNEKEDKFVVSDLKQSKDQFGYYIEGTVKNNSGKEAGYIQVSFNLFDKDGNQVGTAIDNTTNLAKDGTWKFKAIGIDSNNNIASYKLAEVTGY